MVPQRLEKIKSAPGNGMGSEASNPQDVVHGRAADRALRPTKKWGGLGERKGGALPRRPTSDCWIVFFSVNDNILSVKDKSCLSVLFRSERLNMPCHSIPRAPRAPLRPTPSGRRTECLANRAAW